MKQGMKECVIERESRESSCVLVDRFWEAQTPQNGEEWFFYFDPWHPWASTRHRAWSPWQHLETSPHSSGCPRPEPSPRSSQCSGSTSVAHMPAPTAPNLVASVPCFTKQFPQSPNGNQSYPSHLVLWFHSNHVSDLTEYTIEMRWLRCCRRYELWTRSWIHGAMPRAIVGVRPVKP